MSDLAVNLSRQEALFIEDFRKNYSEFEKTLDKTDYIAKIVLDAKIHIYKQGVLKHPANHNRIQIDILSKHTFNDAVIREFFKFSFSQRPLADQESVVCNLDVSFYAAKAKGTMAVHNFTFAR